MPNPHALLSASSSHRWLACPPSALLSAEYEETNSEFAKQGSEAHQLCEYKLKKRLGLEAEDPTPKLSFYDEEMEECAEDYVQYVQETLSAIKECCSDPIVLIEQRLDFSRWVPKGFGTGDCIIIADGTAYVIDFKYGLGLIVEAERNPQMMCYALGALHLFDGIYDIDTVSMSIFQPRRENVSVYTLEKEELLDWAESTLAPTAQLAAKGEGEFLAGEHCRFCKVKAVCRKRAEHNLQLASYDFEMPKTLSDTEIECILGKIDDLVAWAGDVKDYALEQALRGKDWKDWKLVEGRSVRKYANEDKVAETVQEAGFDPYEQKILGITAMTKLLGKKRFEELLQGLIVKPQGKPTLAPMSDKRPSLNTINTDFMEEN